MFRILIALLVAGTLGAQTQAPENKDPLGRTTPQEAIVHFLEACHSRDYGKALLYLDLRKMPAAQRAQEGPKLAGQLEDLLDDTAFEITTLSRAPEGDQADGLAPGLERLATFKVQGKTLEMHLERVELTPGVRVWLVSPDSIAMIPQAHQLVEETPFEKTLPQPLVTFEILDTPVWRWIALILIGAALWAAAGVLTRALTGAVQRFKAVPAFWRPLRVLVTAAGLRAAMEFAPPATLSRTFLERALTLIFVLGLAGVVGGAVDLAGERWRSRLDPRMQAVSFSVLPLVLQIVKLSLYVIAILGTFGAWGYNTTTILAGLGVGGLAVALAAQKTIENLFGGISVIGDRPVLVGDVCRFGDRVGTVMHIGLRSTRLRTADRTIVSVPNAQFSAMELENISGRDKIWFHPTLNLRRDTTSEQLLKVLASCREILTKREKVETGKIPVRFIGVGPYSLDIEADAYVATGDFDEFIAIRQELLIEMLRAVEQAGTGLAVPLQESFDGGKVGRAAT
ncbi:MAG TPA: mechanosensitive ion channel family protein [Bryobacteraceae bacterium]|nr:mechanosensitive ion channel family protein [Bryobacteraceae bacterium]